MSTLTLLEYQTPVLPQILRQLREHGISINASDTGTGKTYLTLAAIQASELPVFVECPKGVIPMWREVLEAYLPPDRVLDVTNIEKLKTGKTPWLQRNPPIHPKGKPTFRWTIPGLALLVFDEVHRYAGTDSQNAFILAYTKGTGHQVLPLSATLADSPAKLRALGYLMGFHNFVDFDRWAVEHGCYRDTYNSWRYAGTINGTNHLLDLHKRIFPEFGVRLRVSEIEGFPQNFIDVLLIDGETTAADTRRHKERYPEVFSDIEDAETSAMMSDILAMAPADRKPVSDIVRFLRARQRAELAKIRWWADKVQDLIEEGVSVVSFFNFKAPIRELVEALDVRGTRSLVLTGDTKDRETVRKTFQENEVFHIAASHGAGGVGISLHDLKGRSRASLMSPPLAALPFTQAIGRIHRAGSLSAARQYVVCARATPEERVRKNLKSRLANQSTLQDGDFAPELQL